MSTLYLVTFFYRDFARPVIPVLVSERNVRLAIKRARALVGSTTECRIGLNDTRLVCKTPDDVLELM